MSIDANTDLLPRLMPTLSMIDASSAWHITTQPIRARKCDIYKISGGNRTLALKVYKPGIASDAAPALQYEALQRCNKAALNQPALRAPKALAFLPDERAILMEWQTAATLRATLWRKFNSSNQRLDLVRRSGAWLRAFHELSDVSIEPLDGRKLSAKLDTQIKPKPCSATRLIDSIPFNRALDRFREIAASFNEPTPHALLHGDFTPTNLLADDTEIVGMDMWGARSGPAFEDIARMLAYLGVVSPFALARAPLDPQGSLTSEFMQGYGEDVMNAKSSAFHLVLLYQQLRRWLVYADKKASSPMSPMTHWQHAQNQRLCLQTLTWLDHCKT